MTKDWTFDQPLDDNTPTSSSEERAKIAALFHKENQEGTEDVDYVAAFEMEQQKAKEKSLHNQKLKSNPHQKRCPPLTLQTTTSNI